MPLLVKDSAVADSAPPEGWSVIRSGATGGASADCRRTNNRRASTRKIQLAHYLETLGTRIRGLNSKAVAAQAIIFHAVPGPSTLGLALFAGLALPVAVRRIGVARASLSNEIAHLQQRLRYFRTSQSLHVAAVKCGVWFGNL